MAPDDPERAVLVQRMVELLRHPAATDRWLAGLAHRIERLRILAIGEDPSTPLTVTH